MTNTELELVEAIEALLEYIPSECDENVHPAWCSTHQMKCCTGTADVAKVRALLEKLNPSPPASAEESKGGR